ncbi:flagellar filament capping protein FliD [Stutzerimonas stutzeri]|jgi:flagellar hook-associated protein 2|uniref:flagellar filament capping protein FliD n=1 Tax=Stutzerimonas stutzeri TaxID=316 RepID=UPI000DAB5AEE|nr:flagellar filament capping protein FliD [Stutzerimonas stutzeri]RAA03821.1 branched-chain alpha-keto acid dehydrogenase subunit E2 [Stutzerimonas stutzeri]TGY14842.1 branched-chain alpha-keto acid dehydrogenase subunit E2 [Stutzerimonas stutzeri]GBC56404.1 flagellar hook-associated protein FliD [Stutzerimonas stutzeri]HAB84637.1 branched-chain alpha-keto acid dehydrogenase subunit E2 [Pseudomonas sp.]
MARVTGIGSGIDIDSIVASMVAAERAPKETQLATLEKKTTTQITAVGALKGAISDFQTALGALNKPELFQARSATSSKSDLVGVTATTTAGAGSYQLEVKSLASSSKVALAAIPNTAEAPARFTSGTFEVSLGVPGIPPEPNTKESFSVTIDENNNTLAGVRDAINTAGIDMGVSATIVTDEYGSRLVLSSSKTGAGRDITVTATGADEPGLIGLSALNFDGTSGTGKDARVLTSAQSAELYVDGLKVISETNKVDGAIEGVTLDLKAKTVANEPLTIAVAEDKAGVKKQIQTFVDSYNKLIGVINAQTKVTSVGEDKAPVTGALVGDATARTLLNTIRNELVSVQGDGALRALTDIGITTQKDGTLAIDSAKLDKAMASNFGELSGLFTGDKGLASRLDAKLKPYTETGGILEQRNKAMTETITKIDDQKEALTRRIASLQERLYKQFNAMDMLVGQLSNTSSSLLASLENLPWAASNSKK